MVDDLEICNIDIQSYLLLKDGVKPVVRVGLGRSRVDGAKEVAKKLGLEVIVKEFKHLYGGELPETKINAYYSLDKNLCRKALDAENGGDRKKFGLILGYPECCIDSFIKNLSLGVDYFLISNRNTTAKPSFFCNNLFVFDSKISGEQESNIFQKNASIFDSMNIKRSFLIRHVPCSFDCNDSIEIGKKTLRLLKRHSPDLAGKIVDALKKPVLYWNYFEWIVLNGSAERRVLVYDSILGFESLIGNDIKKMVLSGNKVKIMDDNLSIFRGSEKIGDIPVKNGLPLCIDFQ